jgi:asparagine synthase (glutamine-hydrolysing)
MCGITGFFGKKNVDLRKYYMAHSVLSHRGPDDEGFILKQQNGQVINCFGEKTIETKKKKYDIREQGESKFCLGHHRLSIIDLSEGGHQPLQSNCGRYYIVFNGEIYNYLELRDELKALRYSFKTSSDTEVIITAFSHWREESFKKFNGMWAMVIYDSTENLCFMSRDRFGIKPLYLYQSKEVTYFASEMKFFKSLGLNLSLNDSVAIDYLSHCLIDHTEQTFYNEIQSFPAAHYAVFSGNGDQIRQKRYWNIEICENKSTTSYNTAKEELRELLHSSLEFRLQSDVPVGTLLSGGLDSTAIVCLLTKYFDLPRNELSAFSAVFEEEEFSEKKYIEDTVRQNPTINSHYIYPSPKDLETDFCHLLETIETPFRSLAVYSQHCIYRYIKNETDIVVLLNGQGSDEIFAGYRNHYAAYFSELIYKGNFVSLAQEIKWMRRYRKHEINTYLYQTLSSSIPNRVKKIIKKIRNNKSSIMSLFEGNIVGDNPLGSHKNLSSILLHDLNISALPEYLRYEDRNSMAYSLESRLPFLDYRMVEWAFKLPSNFKIKNGLNKRILRETFSNDITPSVQNRKDKMGFVSPQQIWQKNVLRPWMEKVILSKDKSGLLNQSNVESLYKQYVNGNNTTDSWIWWRIFCFKVWYHSVF